MGSFVYAEDPAPVAAPQMPSLLLPTKPESMQYTPDGKYLVVFGEDQKLYVIKPETRSTLRVVDLSFIGEGFYTRLNTAPKGGYIDEAKRKKGQAYAHLKAQNYENGKGILIDVNLETGEVTRVDLPPSDGGSPFISPTGEHSYGEGSDNIFTLGEHEQNEVIDMSFSPDGRFVAAMSMHRVRSLISIYNIAEKKKIFTIVEPDYSPAMVLSRDAKYIIAANSGKILRVTRVDKDEETKSYLFEHEITALALSPKDNSVIVALENGSLMHFAVIPKD